MRYLAALLTALILVTGCTATPDSGTATETPSASTPSVTPNDSEELFLTVIHEEYPELAGGEADANMIALAHSTCEALDAGASMEEVTDAAIASVDNDEDARLVGFVMGVGIAAFCPRHEHLIGGSNYV